MTTRMRVAMDGGVARAGVRMEGFGREDRFGARARARGARARARGGERRRQRRRVGVDAARDEDRSGIARAVEREVLRYARSPVPVYVMLPLNVVTNDGCVNDPEALRSGLRALRDIGIEGVMLDVWWGIVERHGPRKYDWEAYREVMDEIKAADLKVQAVMSFHACGANVGDVVEIPLPDWVLEAGEKDPDLFFTDQYGYRNPECISLWADNASTLAGRTPMNTYKDFMISFRNTFKAELGTTLTEVAVGCGPCGELRYPAYPENKFAQRASQWTFPGIGEFQCYDQRALVSLARAASEAGHIEWGGSGPHDTGGYNNLPFETGFFRYDGGSWDSDYGFFFLSWYSGELVNHGDRMLEMTKRVFNRTGVTLAIKCAGVHWWYNVRSHAAELTAGYFNTRAGEIVPERDGYAPIVKVCKKHGARLNFTCVEMHDSDHPWYCYCGPEGLLRQIRSACARYEVPFAGENALCRFDQAAYDKIIRNCAGEGHDEDMWREGTMLPPMACFTFLRFNNELFSPHCFESFRIFVQRMRDETGLLDTSVDVRAEDAEGDPDEISSESRVQLGM